MWTCVCETKEEEVGGMGFFVGFEEGRRRGETGEEIKEEEMIWRYEIMGVEWREEGKRMEMIAGGGEEGII